MSIGSMPCSATALRCEGLSRRCRMPPCTLGWSVFTRPSSISGKPVSSEMSFTRTPESRNSLEVPPVEISSTPRPASLWANSTSPVLSVTLRMARCIFVWVADMADLDGKRNVPGKGREILSVSSRQSSVVGQEGEQLTTDDQRLSLRFCLQFYLAVLHLDRVFDRFAAVLFADLIGFLLHEGRKTVEVAGDGFSRFLLGFGEGLVEPSHLIAFRARIAALHAEGSFLGCGERGHGGRGGGACRRDACFCSCRGPGGRRQMPNAVDFVFRFTLFRTHSLDGENCILWAAVAFFADAVLLPP